MNNTFQILIIKIHIIPIKKLIFSNFYVTFFWFFYINFQILKPSNYFLKKNLNKSLFYSSLLFNKSSRTLSWITPFLKNIISINFHKIKISQYLYFPLTLQEDYKRYSSSFKKRCHGSTTHKTSCKCIFSLIRFLV